MLAGLAFKSRIRFNQEVDFAGKAFGEVAPALHIENEAKMAHWNGLGINVRRCSGRALVRREMCDDLVAEKVEVDPVLAAAAFRAAEQVPIKCAGYGEVVNGKGEVERRHKAGLASEAWLF